MENKEVNNETGDANQTNQTNQPGDLGNHITNILRLMLQPNNTEPRVRVNENKNEYYGACTNGPCPGGPCASENVCNMPASCCPKGTKCRRNVSKTKSRRRRHDEEEDNDEEEEYEECDEEDDEEDDESTDSAPSHDRTDDSWDALLQLVDNQRKLCKAFLVLLEWQYGVDE